MNFLPPLPVTMPLLVAAVLVAAAPVRRRWIIDVVATATAALMLVVLLLLVLEATRNPIVYWFGNWQPRQGIPIGIAFFIDPAGATLGAFTALLTTAALAYSWKYFEAVKTYFHALMLIFLAGMAGFCLTGDLFNLFVFFELMGVVAYALTAYKIEEASAIEGSINFAITNSVASFALLMGIALVYGRTGSLNFAEIGQILGSRPADGLVVIAFCLIASGLLTKAAIVPFHLWLTDAHAVAPTPVCVLFSGIMVELGIYGLIRVYSICFARAIDVHAWIVLCQTLGGLTAVGGAWLCYSQRHIKRMLAASTISHAGLLLMAGGLPAAMGGLVVYLLGHGLVKAALFMTAGILLQRFGSVDEHVLRGRARASPVSAILLTIGGIALAGAPPFGTYVGKAAIEHAASAYAAWWIKPVYLFASFMTAAAILRVACGVGLGWGQPPPRDDESPTEQDEKETEPSERETPAAMIVVPAVLLALALAVAVVPVAMGEKNVEHLISSLNPPLQAEPPRPEGRSLFGGESLAWGIASVALALLLAGAGIGRHRLPGTIQRVIDGAVGPLNRLTNRLHSGDVGDYVTWMTVGLAALGVGLVSLLRR